MVAIFSGYLGATLCKKQQLEEGLELLCKAQQKCEELGDRTYSSTFYYLQAESLSEVNPTRAAELYFLSWNTAYQLEKALFSASLAYLWRNKVRTSCAGGSC